jgi:hypothetical protein
MSLLWRKEMHAFAWARSADSVISEVRCLEAIVVGSRRGVHTAAHAAITTRFPWCDYPISGAAHDG